jgi:hypothetical protein
VIKDFGEVRLFINIRDAEGRHINALLTLFARYGVSVPPNAWVGRVKRFPNVQAACKAPVVGEIANGEMYERLLKLTNWPDILTILGNLQEASQQRHLPEFQRCSQGGEKGQGQGGRGWVVEVSVEIDEPLLFSV